MYLNPWHQRAICSNCKWSTPCPVAPTWCESMWYLQYDHCPNCGARSWRLDIGRHTRTWWNPISWFFSKVVFS